MKQSHNQHLAGMGSTTTTRGSMARGIMAMGGTARLLQQGVAWGHNNSKRLFPHKGNKDQKVVALGMQHAWVDGSNSNRRLLLYGRRWGGIKDG